MKKLFSVLAALCLVFAVASNAAADFTYGANSSLGLSVYNEATSVEIGYDLGVVGVDFDLTDENVDLGSIDVSDLDATVAVYSATSVFDFTYGVMSEDALGVATGSAVSFQGSVSDIFNIAYFGQTSPYVTTTADPKGAFAAYGEFGNYRGIVPGGSPDLQPELASLATADFIDIGIYSYNFSALTAEATLRIEKDGDVILNPVPVPAAAWLLGSGLLGLIGIRRKNS